ncbi:MAG TPA: TAT-variant-translocated molybdopterin oxidoreductase, partial [Patescibacteria group bacterium]|nr:TAT-variant-translocated molybdopterin oxidoreductase [Patescibacteria group bacterium]
MKTIPPPCPEPDTGPKYWRSLDQLAETPEFREWAQREFPAGASELSDPTSRRNFVKIMSASFLLAGLGGGCRRPVEKILPFGRMPENYIHGVPQFYATARPTRSGAVPLVVKTSEGRPIKIEGNALHPDSNGGTDTFTQASILNLYDPDRATRFAKDGNAIAPEVALDFLDNLGKRFQGLRGQGLSILGEAKNSPSRDRLLALLGQRAPQTRWHVYDPLDLDMGRRVATAALGRSVRPYYQFDKASVILSLDADFLGAEEECERHIRNFAKSRRQTKSSDPMSRLYVIESLMTITGANADHRLRKASSAIGDIAAQFATAIVDKGPVQDQWISECAKDLLANHGKALVVAGHGQPAAVHTLVLAINQALGSVGQTLSFIPVSEVPENSIEELVKDLNAGEVDTLVILGGNPIYNAPADLDFPAAIKKAKQVIRLGYYEDETFSACTWHLPEAHYLESWGDARTGDGTLVAIQPLIEPLFGGITELEILARISGSTQTKPYDIARETFRGVAGNNLEAAWGKFLHDGFVERSAALPVAAPLKSAALAQAKSGLQKAPANGALEVIFRRDYRADDGRYVNNGWLQEFPDPITKIVWENVITLSQATAGALGIKVENHENNQLYVPWLRVEVGGRTIEGPAWIQAGQADGT